ncbi:hypothetical protein ARALYDRAFT_904962 [Arabidopsis lyrata subsp. lyrata]|uniref:Uncharacterized protein n=1 Tax=Arabidopsis lyrata subsp. lyrata TaxID=81972 RepID=D7LM01_ARALL|nr:hypothetical protein ARALYDRAFT_904962 [Arabidopsis lyrata subsp. lyrata]
MRSDPDPDWNETLDSLVSPTYEGINYILLLLAFQATIYYKCRERNEMKHNKTSRSHTQLAHTIDKMIRSRIMSLLTTRTRSFEVSFSSGSGQDYTKFG